MPGKLVDDPHVDAIFGLRAAEQVGDIKRLLVLHRGHEILFQRSEMLGRHRGVVVPPDRVLGLGVADDELVLRAAAGVLAGLDHHEEKILMLLVGSLQTSLNKT